MTTSEFFSNIEKKNILVIGDVMLDAYLFGKVDRISPEAPVPVVSVLHRDNRPGGAANVAINIRSLGATPYLCSVIGNDDKNHLFLQLMNQHKLPVDGIIHDESRPTTTKFRIIGNNAQMLRVDEETTSQISQSKSNELFQKIQNIVHQVSIDCILFQDYDKGVISHELISKTINLAISKQIPVVVDPKQRNFYNYNNVSLFKPNLKEFKEGIKEKISSDYPEDLAEVMKNFGKQNNIKNLMVTLSDKGMLIVSAEESGFIHLQAHLRRISDVSGAGDTVISVAALCMAAGLSLQHMAALSNLAGGLVCQYVGVVPIDKQEFFDEIERLKLLS